MGNPNIIRVRDMATYYNPSHKPHLDAFEAVQQYLTDDQLRAIAAIWRAVPEGRVLDVPYFSQRDNPRNPYGTCNVTSIAMVLTFYGLEPRLPSDQLEDELLQWIYDRYGEGGETIHANLQELYRAYGYKGGFSTTRTWAEIRAAIDSGVPAVVAGNFTASGHIVVLIGYQGNTWTAHDPWGDATTDYRGTNGFSVRYSQEYLERVCGKDGDVWCHLIYGMLMEVPA